ncbi:MAG: hypothetical protein V3V00_16020 [Saprospiraceae bacterium]
MSFQTIFEAAFRRDISAFSIVASTIDASGKNLPGSKNPFTIKASCQPSKPEDVALLPEGRRNNGGTYTIYTNDNLNTITGSQNPDQISLFGEIYETFQSEVWANDLINHNKYLAIKIAVNGK